jgi:hypothetical protein
MMFRDRTGELWAWVTFEGDHFLILSSHPMPHYEDSRTHHLTLDVSSDGSSEIMTFTENHIDDPFERKIDIMRLV